MLRPIIMIGCGGSGQKAVRYVRDAVDRHLQHRGYVGGIPQAWQFLGIDTAVKQEDPDIPFMPNSDYMTVSLAFKTYQDLSQALEAKFGNSADPRAFRDLIGWRPNPSEVSVPLQDGAGQLRAVGRAAGVLALQGGVKERLSQAFTACKAGGPELSGLSEHLGVSTPPGAPVPDPIVLIIGSMAGGTGAGISLDVVDLVRRIDNSGQFPVLIAFTPDIFGPVSTDLMTANSAGFMAELLSAYWDSELSDNVLIPALVPVHTRGPESVFLIGRKNFDGLDLGNSKNVYRAVGEALGAVVTSQKVQEAFFHFITANWPARAPANAGGYGFGDEYMDGVVSSFGSATVSIGRDRFREYFRKLLHREIVEHLTDGFESVATEALGDKAVNMAGQAKIAELMRRNLDRFLLDCGLTEGAEGHRQVSGGFVTRDIQVERSGQVATRIKSAFGAAGQQSAQAWAQVIGAQATQVRTLYLQEQSQELNAELRTWGSELLSQVLRASTSHAAELSIPVVLAMIENARARVLASSSFLKEESKKAHANSEMYWQNAQKSLSQAGKGNLQASSAPVGAATTAYATSIVLEWASQTYERLSVALEQASVAMLSSVEAALRQSLNRMSLLTQPQDGEDPVVQLWPRNDGVVPANFKPSPVEFFLEDWSTWPSLATSLLKTALSEETGLPLDPVKAARVVIIRGGFNSDDRVKKATGPLVWVNGLSGSAKPVWEPGNQVDVTVSDDLEHMAERIDAWLMRPSTEISHVLSEGLNSYLQAKHPKTGAAIPDHQQRLSTFSQRLKEALNQSKPLIEVDVVMNSTVHPQPLVDGKKAHQPMVQGFPFGVGHPARAETEAILQAQLGGMASVDSMFTGGDAESVLITRFLEYPVNPSVVTSFTKPLAVAMDSFQTNPKLITSSFWQWRRARVLENFIPLPDELRRAAIRGFAVARILGTITALPDGQNRISSAKGVFDFPRYLLTQTNQNNFLPALLEAMILMFADAPTRGKAAFDAYGELVNYGLSGGRADDFSVVGDFARILGGEDHGSIKIVDEGRAKALLGDADGPKANALKYLEANLLDFANLEATPLSHKSWRNKVGQVDPPDTLRHEILHDLIAQYSKVRDAVARFEPDGVLGTGGGSSV
jgi:hypothetical protein